MKQSDGAKGIKLWNKGGKHSRNGGVPGGKTWMSCYVGVLKGAVNACAKNKRRRTGHFIGGRPGVACKSMCKFFGNNPKLP